MCFVENKLLQLLSCADLAGMAGCNVVESKLGIEAAATLGKSVGIAALAALAALVPAAISLNDGSYWIAFIYVALIGSFGVGLPVAALVYWFARRELLRRPALVFLFANLAGAILALTSALLGDLFGLWAFGLPSLLAANTFAMLGWLWIIRPAREALYD